MGFFSWECEVCKHSIRAPYCVNKDSKWMNDAVFIMKNGSIKKGHYDGYGNISNGYDDDEYYYNAPTAYHRLCWQKVGSPVEHKGESKPAQDQGFFVGEYDPKFGDQK
jgi:hypothetical protein